MVDSMTFLCIAVLMSDVAACGLRVVRGADWEWGDQDGGEGCVGTVIEVGGQGGSKNPKQTAVVLWDSGSKGNYRLGYQDKYDLRVIDNAPAGESFYFFLNEIIIFCAISTQHKLAYLV
jgi:Mib_herc2